MIRRLLYFIGIVLSVVVIVSCGGGKSTEGAGCVINQQHGNIIGDEADLKVYIPEIPDSIVDPDKRLEYAVVHYWDQYSFSDKETAQDTISLEQSFSNYISLLDAVNESVKDKSVDRFVAKALINNDETSQLVDDVVRKYLDEPNSPMRNEDLFIVFLGNMVSSENVPEAIRLRAEYSLKQAMKNRSGMKGADFPVLTLSGERTTFIKELKGDTTLVMFYDPDCEQCKEISTQLSRTPLPETLKIFAIDVAGDKSLWEKTKNLFPADWKVGYAEISLEDEGLYTFRALPTFYIFASDGKVILKDPSPDMILQK